MMSQVTDAMLSTAIRAAEDKSQQWQALERQIDLSRAALALPLRSEGEAAPLASFPHGLKPGLYRVFWLDGSNSEAAVGMKADGTRWFAATNWVHPSENSSADFWSEIERIEALSASPQPPQPVVFMDRRGEVSVPEGSPIKALLEALSEPPAPLKGQPLLALYAAPLAQPVETAGKERE